MDARMAGLTAVGSPTRERACIAADVATRVGDWGFLAHPDLPDGPGPAFLLVALRPAPTLQHYDPEAVDYWVTEAGRGERRTLTYASPMPRTEDFAWGLIRLVDRLGVSNEYLTFGGHLDAASVDEVVVAAFASPAPLLRRGAATRRRWIPARMRSERSSADSWSASTTSRASRLPSPKPIRWSATPRSSATHWTADDTEVPRRMRRTSSTACSEVKAPGCGQPRPSGGRPPGVLLATAARLTLE